MHALCKNFQTVRQILVDFVDDFANDFAHGRGHMRSEQILPTSDVGSQFDDLGRATRLQHVKLYSAAKARLYKSDWRSGVCSRPIKYHGDDG